MLSQLQMLRLSKGLKAVDVASKAGISPSLLSKIERGHIRPADRTKKRLAKALRVGVKTLFPS